MKFIPLIIHGPDEKKTEYPLGKSLFTCKDCKSYIIEEDAYLFLATMIGEYAEAFNKYQKYYFASRGAGRPEFNFAFIKFKCSNCSKEHKAFFYCQFNEDYFPKKEREFLLADITDQSVEDNVDGVYKRDCCQAFMQKLFIRWQILKNITYIVVPFIGNGWQTSEQRLSLWGEFLESLSPFNTVIVTRPETMTQFQKDLDIDIGEGAYETLNTNGKLNPLIGSTVTKKDFHAKFYCGISESGVEVLVGSHNLHGGNSMENILFKTYDLGKFIDRYLLQINVVPVVKPSRELREALIFQGTEIKMTDSFTNNAMELRDKYFDSL